MSSPHKPRRRKKVTGTSSLSSSASPVNTNPTGTPTKAKAAHVSFPEFPLVSFLWPARKSTSQWVILPVVLMVVGLFRWAVGFWGYSGFQSPPMHGDYEAQRHWMEITNHLPVSLWYFYDLQYWGLDYPPLTAYHSWLLGKVGSFINPTWFALGSSRGIENPDLKIFMRATVLVSEYLIYIPAAIIFARRQARLKSVNVWEASIALVAILMQPATMLIDHGHFQYNTVMLGFVLASMSSMFANRLLWGCVFFVAALSFKQMALYYAPAIFAYLLGVCLFPKPRIFRLLAIAFVTLTSFVAMFTPILLGSLYENMQDPSIALTLPPPPLLTSLPIDIDRNSPFYPIVLQLSQSLHRIFPFARGLFEDKVANLWCALHTIHKLTTYPNSLLTRLSLVCTIAAILPACTIILLYPRKALLPYSLAACAWGFFLCSFQVHEKSVLLPLLPMTVLLGSSRGIGPELRAWIGWANALGVWTMYPLLQRDGLRVPYAILALLWAYLLGLPPASWVLYSPAHGELTAPTKLLHLSFYIAMGIWHVLEAGLAPPKGKPDLWVVINCVVGAVGFALCWAWCTWQVVIRSGFLEEWIGVRVRFDEGQEERVDGKANARRKRQ